MQFEEFYAQYRNAAAYECVKSSVDPKDVEDIVQETMVKLWNRFDDLTGTVRDNENSWLLACVKRETYFQILEFKGMHNYGRETAKQKISFLNSVELSDFAPETLTSVAASDFSPSAEDVFFYTHRHDFLWDAVDSLPALQRDCLTLRYYNEMSRASIADKLGISVRGVETYIQAGKRALQRSLVNA